MDYNIVWVRGHVEVYDWAGRFCFSADNEREALEELEAELLREEQEEAQLPEEVPEEPEYRNFSNDYGRLHAYNRDVEDADLDDFVQQVHTAGNRSRVMGRVALALALLAAACVLLAICAVRYW